MLLPRSPRFRALPGLLFLAVSAAAGAATELEITLIGGATTQGSPGDGYLEMIDAGSGMLSLAESANSSGGSSMSIGSVGFGWALGESVAIHAGAGTAQASTQSLFRDDLTITAPGASGAGNAVFRIDVDGGLSAATSGTPGQGAGADWNAFVRSSTQASGQVIALGALDEDSMGTTTDGDLDGGSYEWTIPFAFGTPFEITVVLNTSSGVGDCCSATSDFGSTLTWGGVVEVRDSQGMLVPDWSIASGSGADYGQVIPAPEPGGPALGTMAAVGLLTRLACRRRTGG